MRKGLSPIIATMLLVAIAISIGTVVSIFLRSQAQEYMIKEGERRERILDKEGESLVLVHIEIDGITNNPKLKLQNNGTSDVEVGYVKLNEIYKDQTELTCSFSDYELGYNESGDVEVLNTGITDVEDIYLVEIGSTLGSIFVYNAPTPHIAVTGTFFDTDNRIVTVSGTGSEDDGQIVKWVWWFSYDEATGLPLAIDGDDGIETGVVASYDYPVPGTDTPYKIRLIVTDETGMVGSVWVEFIIPA